MHAAQIITKAITKVVIASTYHSFSTPQEGGVGTTL